MDRLLAITPRVTFLDPPQRPFGLTPTASFTITPPPPPAKLVTPISNAFINGYPSCSAHYDCISTNLGKFGICKRHVDYIKRAVNDGFVDKSTLLAYQKQLLEDDPDFNVVWRMPDEQWKYTQLQETIKTIEEYSHDPFRHLWIIDVEGSIPNNPWACLPFEITILDLADD